jgi:formylglycine-generating enzyme required for sulfatase activity
VGNPGNGGDVQPQGTFGAVDYVYRISKHEVTNAQYTEFLNAVDPTGANALSLYHPGMSSDVLGGINLDSFAANASKYQVKSGRDNNPVVLVTFIDAMRFTNWLENGQGSGSTESGVYAIRNGLSETRNPNATYFIPSENEWYKAAYHKNDGATANYWGYPTSTDTIPFSDQPPGSGAPTQSNTANFEKNDGVTNGYDDGFAVTGSMIFTRTHNYLTDVGSYTASLSPYGTFDQGGNVIEWNETVYSTFLGAHRGVRGGSFFLNSDVLAASTRFFPPDLSNESEDLGFRVASRIPEPGTGLLGLFAAAGLLLRRRPPGSLA